MQRIFPGSPKLIFAFLVFLSVWSCTKIDTTTLGGDLIPAVDNVHTFADTLNINGVQGVFDDTFTRVTYADYHALGSITNDPVFGTTNSDLYLQLKPAFYPFYFGNSGDTINNIINPGPTETGFDSVVLCLSYKTFYGDSNISQQLSVYQLDNAVDLNQFKDSAYKLDFRPGFTAGETLIGSATIDPRRVKDTVHFPGSKKEVVNNQVRIKLDVNNNSFLQSIIGRFNRDTGLLSSMYRSDSLFKDKIKGFRIKADGVGNGLFYVSLTDATTRLEIHYKKTKDNIRDTTYSAFYFSTGLTSTVSAQATHMDRNRSIPWTDTTVLNIQTTPGTFANLSIPGLSTMQNSIIHRAEIFIEQVPSMNPIDKIMLPPSYLYLDLINDTSATNKFKPVYFDLNPTASYLPDDKIYFLPSAGIDFNYFGGYLRLKDAGTLNEHHFYTFNVSRHVQHIVTNGIKNYSFRLYAPVNLSYYGYIAAFRNLLADGRVTVGNGNNKNGYKMYMRIVYSKI